MPIFGNDRVIAKLEQMLAEARKGQYGYLAAMMVGKDVPAMGGWYGSVYLEGPGFAALHSMMEALEKDVMNRVLPERAENISADRVVYNVPAFPTSYDFINWLVDAEMTRRVEGSPSPLKVAFWFGRDGKTGLPDAQRRAMFDGVMRPALALVGAVEDDSAVNGRSPNLMCPKNIVAMAKAGREVAKLKAPPQSVLSMARYRGAVTITLREYLHFPSRNSKTSEWIRFAKYLKKQGERVIFVRDTTRALDPIDGFETCPEASIDLHRRLALYESAKINLFTSNGPASLGFYGDWPWLIFMPLRDNSYEYEPNTPKFWHDFMGVEMGEQFPWWRPADQRIVWKDDTYENMVEAWESLPNMRCVA